MPEVLLFPRLHRLGVQQLLQEPDLLRNGTMQDRMAEVLSFTSYAASGGSRVRSDQLSQLQSAITSIAGRNGFPDRGTTAARASFDAQCAAWLGEHGPIQGGEALRDDVWAFVTCCVAPDVALWRFDGAHPNRFHGGIRNTFQRLWLRGHLFDRGVESPDRWGLLNTLTEDALVQITERPAISANPEIAKAIAEAWVATAVQVGRSSMEAVTRRATKKVRLANELISFSGLDAASRKQNIRDRFRSETPTPLPPIADE